MCLENKAGCAVKPPGDGCTFMPVLVGPPPPLAAEERERAGKRKRGRSLESERAAERERG